MFNESDIISSYTKADAIRDGQQILMPKEIQNKYGINFDTYITDSVINIIESENFDISLGIEQLAKTFVLAVKSSKENDSYLYFKFLDKKIVAYIGEEYGIEGAVITIMALLNNYFWFL